MREVLGQKGSSIDPAVATVLAIAAAIGTAGTATPAVMATLFGEVGGVIASAVTASVASQTASSLVMNEGNLKQVTKELASSRALKSYAIAVASAGLMHQLTGVLNLPPQPKGFEQHLKVNLVRAGVSAGLNMTIGGMKPEDALVSAVRMIAAGTLGGLGANEIAQVYSDGQLDYLTHKLMHALLGSGLGAILSEDIPQGMLSGALGAVLAETVAEALPAEMTRELRADVGKIGAALGASLMGQEVATGIFTACNALENNFMTQEDDLLQRKKQEEEELEQVLGYLSPMNQAGQGLLQEVLSEDHPRTREEVKAQRDYQRTMLGWEDHADDFGGSYSSVGTLIEAKQKAENASLRELDTRGRERARQKIYPHRRSQSPPRLKTTVVEEGKETVVRVGKAAMPEAVKALIPYVQKGLQGVEQGKEIIFLIK